jgi:hypothetical protein
MALLVVWVKCGSALPVNAATLTLRTLAGCYKRQGMLVLKLGAQYTAYTWTLIFGSKQATAGRNQGDVETETFLCAKCGPVTCAST